MRRHLGQSLANFVGREHMAEAVAPRLLHENTIVATIFTRVLVPIFRRDERRGVGCGGPRAARLLAGTPRRAFLARATAL